MKQVDDNNQITTTFAVWSDRVERVIAKGILLLAILLCIFQLALQFPAARHWLTTMDDSEGVPFHYVVR